MARKKRRAQGLKVVNRSCAGIDTGKDRHFVAVDPERTEKPVRSFGAFTRDLEEMVAWLASCGVTKVAMELNSVYRIPVYETLERTGFEVIFVPPGMTMAAPADRSGVLRRADRRSRLPAGGRFGRPRGSDCFVPAPGR